MKKTFMKKLATGVVAAGTILSLLQVPNVLAENEVASSQNEKNVVVKVNKELDIAEGITTPTATFTFKFAPKSGQNSANVPYETVTPTNGTIPNRTVTYGAGDTLPQGKTAITKATDDIFAGVTYANAGEYVYTVSEEQTGWTALANNIDTLTFDTKTYEMHVFVKNKSQGTGTYISNVYFVDTTAGSTTAATAKKAGNTEAGTEGGSKVYKYDLFKNKYTKKAGKTGDTPSTINPNADALTITKKVAGGLASKTKNFTFKLTFKAASTDETGTYIGTKGSEQIQFTKDVEKEFTLHDGESLVFSDLPAGTKYTLKEEANSGYTPSSAYKENGTQKNGTTGTQSQAYTVADVLVGEKENNNIVTNTLPEVTPTGLLIDNLPFIIMIGLGLLGFILVAKNVVEKRNNEDMKTNHEKPKKTISRHFVLFLDNLLNHILLLVTALVFLFGFYALWDSNQVYSLASSSEYEAYRPVSSSQKDELASFSGFKKLQNLNSEVIGWINVYGTNIDYPLVQAKDNEKYLTRDSKGEFASTGAIFLDARNNPKFEDFNTIIYGHHVENGVMFGDVAKFSDKEYFEQHRYGSIFYNGQEKGIEIFEMLEVDAYDFNIYDPGIVGEERQEEYIQHLLSVAINKRDISIGKNDHIILLSTCFLDVTNGRHIVVAKITDDIPENTFHMKKSKPFPYSVFDDSSLGKYLSSIPLWIWYIILLVLIIVVLFLLVIVVLMVQQRKERNR